MAPGHYPQRGGHVSLVPEGPEEQLQSMPFAPRDSGMRSFPTWSHLLWGKLHRDLSNLLEPCLLPHGVVDARVWTQDHLCKMSARLRRSFDER